MTKGTILFSAKFQSGFILAQFRGVLFPHLGRSSLMEFDQPSSSSGSTVITIYPLEDWRRQENPRRSSPGNSPENCHFPASAPRFPSLSRPPEADSYKL